MDLLVSLGLGIVTALLAVEIEARAPRISDRLLRFAAYYLPSEQRDRFLEEWRSLLLDIPSPLGKLIHAASIVLSLRRLVLLREIEPAFKFGLGNVTFYLALKRGVVAFEGLQPIVLATKEETIAYLRRYRDDKGVDETDEAVIGMMWAIYGLASQLGVENTMNRLLELIDKDGTLQRR